ncbi:expressed protein [Phakopsora pachyrhizi]|uniref:Expressed protein n=1 Tax=Phakopsora pachyrhizi TaxID=170000 RepID=A0AAV0ARD2_PHAPC|nr:expressed protein [Phakopsora pachyrhizi]
MPDNQEGRSLCEMIILKQNRTDHSKCLHCGCYSDGMYVYCARDKTLKTLKIQIDPYGLFLILFLFIYFYPLSISEIFSLYHTTVMDHSTLSLSAAMGSLPCVHFIFTLNSEIWLILYRFCDSGRGEYSLLHSTIIPQEFSLHHTV